MIKMFKLLSISAVLVAVPLQAKIFSDSILASQETAIIFRFFPKRLMFYSSFKDNDRSIRDLDKLMNEHKDEILRGDAFISIQGFCGSFPSEKENLAAAKNRTNQVKSYFITHGWMKEEYYHTENHAKDYDNNHDVVAYIRLIYAKGYIPSYIAQEKEKRMADENGVGEKLYLNSLAYAERRQKACGVTLRDSLAREQVEHDSASSLVVSEREYYFTPWSVKTNLLYAVVLMPSLEVEYRINTRWSVNLEGNIAWWHNDRHHKYYQLATISPEVRYWFKPQGRHKGHFVGLFAGGGWYDLENGENGYKGEGEFAGISYGYMFPVGKYFSLEAGLGVGYLNTRYEEYLPLDGEYVYQQTSRLNYIGPLKLKFSWVWHIGQWFKKKRR